MSADLKGKTSGVDLFEVTLRRLSKGAPSLPHVEYGVALEALLALQTRRTYRERQERDAGIAHQWSVVREREAQEAANRIARDLDRYADLTSPEEAAALAAFMMAICQNGLKRQKSGRKPESFPDLETMRLGRAYDQIGREYPELKEKEKFKLLLRLADEGHLTISGSAQNPDPKTLEMRVRRALEAYKTRKLPA